MQIRKFRCTNYGSCPEAASGNVFEVEAGKPEVCPGCGRGDTLAAATKGGGGKVDGPAWRRWAAIGIVVLLVAGMFLWKLLPNSAPAPDVAKVPPPDPGISSCKIVPATKDTATKAFFFTKQGMFYASTVETLQKQGMTDAATQKKTDALNEFASAITADPHFLDAHSSRAAAEGMLKRFPEAERDLEEEQKLVKCLSEPGISDEQMAALNYYDQPEHPGRADQTAVLADKMRARVKRVAANTYYNRACLESMEERTPEAIADLKNAVRSGFNNKAQIMSDSQLENARNSKEFHTVLALMS